MSTQTIPAARLREQAEFVALAQREAAYAYAESLRTNRMDWLSANGLINQIQVQGQITFNTLAGVLFDLPAERAEIVRLRDEFDALMEALQEDLRANCLLNGPTQRAR